MGKDGSGVVYSGKSTIFVTKMDYVRVTGEQQISNVAIKPILSTMIVTKKNQRLDVVDALRGFALLAIVMLHSIEHYNLFFIPKWQPDWLTTLDQYTMETVWFLFAGKAYATFSLLFGFSFYIQMRNARRRGDDFRLRFAWRMLLLACFAQLHALFYNGDILLFYAFCGLLIIPASSWSNRTLLIVAGVLLCQPIDWIHLLTAHFNPAYIDTNSHFLIYAKDAERIAAHGNLWEMMVNNIGNGQLYSNTWQVEAGRICQTPALFMLGMWLGRTEKFVCNAANKRFWQRVFVTALVAFAIIFTIKVNVAPMLTHKTWISHFSLALGMPVNFTIMAMLVSMFILCWFHANNRGYRFQRMTIPYGRMSLTNYITQSIIGVAVFYHFGLGLYQYCGPTLSMLIGFVIFGIQLMWSRAWLSSHRQGPLEWVWKNLTWLPGSKQAQATAS